MNLSIRKNKGLATVEYALVGALIALGVAGSFANLGNSVGGGITSISEPLGGGDSGSGDDGDGSGGSKSQIRAWHPHAAAHPSLQGGRLHHQRSLGVR